MRLIDAAFPLLLLLACHLGKLNSTEVASEAEGSVGCLFNKSLCKANSEWCFNDYVFGRCVSYVDADDSDFHRYRLNRESLRVLKRELDKLLKKGYGWRRRYTQCVVKTVLFAIRYRIDYNEEACNSYADHEPFPSYYEGNPETMDPKSVGQVQFTPSVINPHAEFADEIYIPISEKDVFQEAVFPLKGINTHAEDDYSNDLRRTFLLNEINKYKRGRGSRGDETAFETFQRNNDDDDDDDGDDDEEENDELPTNYFAYLNEIPERNEVPDNLREADDILEAFRLDRPSNFPNHYGTHEESMLENLFTNDRNILKSFSRNYNTPEKFRNGHETKDEVIYPKANLFSRPNQPLEVFYYPEDRELIYDTYNEKNVDRNEDSDGGVFTEGGVVYLKDDKKSDEPNSLDELVNTYSNWGFKRPERLDVKKPGPSLSNVFKTQKENPTTSKESKTENVKETSDSRPKTTEIKNILSQPEKKKGGSPMESPSLRRQTTTVQPAKEKDSNNIDNSEFAYVKLKNRVNTWQEGARIVRKVEEILNLRLNTFTNIRVDQNDVRFKVESNRLGLNASEIARRIEVLKGPIQSNTGIEIVSTGVGNQNNLPPSMSLLGEDERQLWILSFLLCGIIAAIAIIGTVFFIIKRHPHARDKLANLTQMDSEASKDYQDLCRARMASKTSQEKPEGNVGGHRVTNLAKENEATNHSPSSRSSTSSWSEEPALTNMDISTGHMVLSYMEDHLKNKDRLEQEWIALCAYEAEPCATTIALKGDNEKKNRYNDVLPYDHARVVLNELSNITGSDYINASTITDHDPRNPAYIASQGPLEQTTADFWQMIWEQGSVVMVMLTRLNENGATICHRYWPEEGSELYHIYEVHLVSEHIWCDDYLVRSFYLKNLKTSETRTVTQFHFLSWPENGVPLSTKALLEFRRKVNKSYRGRSCPVVVHCSDGVGRTGTYCLIDMVLNRMAKGAKEIDIAATLEHIRDQRPLMVRTKQQFEFVLMAVAEEVHAILKALPATLNHSPPPVVKEKE